MSVHKRKYFQNSVGDSWATISTSEESADLSAPSSQNLLDPPVNDNDCDDADLDDTLPVDAFDGIDAPQAQADLLWPSPIPHKEMRDFRPLSCLSSIQLDSELAGKKSESFDFKPKFCSSKLENDSGAPLQRSQSHANHAGNNMRFKSSAPIIREIAKFKTCLKFNSALVPSRSEDFKPQRCSTSLSESELKLNNCPSDMGGKSNLFAPLRCSTGISENEKASLPIEFTPIRTSTGLSEHEHSVAFRPLRCSTELNESTTFNPPMSSTAQHMEDSNIPEFKNLRLRSNLLFNH